MRRVNLIALSIMILVIGLFYAQIWRYSVNTPAIRDDIDVMENTIQIENTINLKEKINLVFKQYGEHKLLFTKLVFLGTKKLLGEYNFKALGFIGSLGLIVILFIFYKTSKQQIFFLLPVMFFLFLSQHWENLYWAMSGLQNFWVIVFMIASLYCATQKEKQYFIPSLLFAFLATFTSGNGFLAFIFSAIPFISRKEFKKTFLWITVFIFTIILYAYKHDFSAIPRYSSVLSNISFIIPFLSPSLRYEGIDYYWIEFIIGFSFLIYLYFLTRIKYFHKNQLVYLVFLLILATDILASIKRASFCPPSMSRYKIYSSLFMIMIYFSVLDLVPKKHLKKSFVIFLVASFLFNAWDYHATSDTITSVHKDLLYRIHK